MLNRDKKAEKFLDSCIRLLEYNDKVLRIIDANLFRTRKNVLLDYVEDMQKELNSMRKLVTTDK